MNVSARAARAAAIGILLLTICVSGCQSTGGPRQAATVREGVFVHITKGAEDPHAVLMGLQMARLMSADRDVLVYFDLRGVEVVLQGGRDITHQAFKSSGTQLNELLNKGVPLYACPGCLRAAGRTPADLRPGVQVADKDAFFSFTPGRVLSIDY